MRVYWQVCFFTVKPLNGLNVSISSQTRQTVVV